MKKLLIKLRACQPAIDWAEGKDWPEIYATCPRGDWLLWLFAMTNPNNLQRLFLAKGHCANTVRHVMMDHRSIKAVDAAIAFGKGKITWEELKDAARAADAARAVSYASYYDSDAAKVAADAAFYAAAAAADAFYVARAADVAFYAARAADAAFYAADAADAANTHDNVISNVADASTKNQQQTADICRKYLPISIWNI